MIKFDITKVVLKNHENHSPAPPSATIEKVYVQSTAFVGNLNIFTATRDLHITQ